MNEIEIVKSEVGAVNRLWIREEVSDTHGIAIYLVLNGIKIVEIKDGYMRSLLNGNSFGTPLKEALFENGLLKVKQ